MQYRDMFKVFIISFLVTTINELAMFASIAIISHKLPVAQFGDFQSFIASMGFFGGLLTLGFSIFMGKYIPNIHNTTRRKEWEDIKKFYSYKVFPVIVFFICLISLSVFAMVFVLKHQRFNHPALTIFFAVALESIFFLSFNYLKAKSKYILATMLYMAKQLSFLILVILLGFYHYSLYWVVFCYLSAYVITMIFFFLLIRHTRDAKPEKQHMTVVEKPLRWRAFILPYTVSTMGIYIFSSLPMIIFEIFHLNNEYEVGEFGALVALYGLCLIGIFPLKAFTVNVIAQVIDSKEEISLTIKKLFLFSLFAALSVSIFFYMIAGFLIDFMSPEYHHLENYFKFMITLIVCVGITNPFSSYMKVSHHARNEIMITIFLTLFFMCFLGIVLSHFYALLGIVLATYLSYVVYMLINIFLFINLRRREKLLN